VGSNHGKVSVVKGKTTYLGRTYGTNEFYILDTSNDGLIVPIGYKDVGSGNTTSIYSMVVQNNLSFLLTKSSFQIWDIEKPKNMAPWTTDSTPNSFFSLEDLDSKSAITMQCIKDIFYIVYESLNEPLFDNMVLISTNI
jgi:hypothetical protein